MSLNKNSYVNICKPILKWVGGKTQIIADIMNIIPKDINNYHEPFLGGGSVLFAILTYQKYGLIKINNIYAYDINYSLISMYTNIQKNLEALIIELNNIINEFNSCSNNQVNRNPTNIDEALNNRENYYYWSRNIYNNLPDKSTCLASALFIFLNKTGFRGLYRIGPNGFNVPYGHYKNPSIINIDYLYEIRDLIKHVNFIHNDFSNVIDDIQNIDDFVYLDPPYALENSKSFDKYTEGGFSIEKHLELFDACKTLHEHNIRFLLSNSDVPLVHENMNNFQIEKILCKRAINSKNPGAKTYELLVKNYD